MDADGLLWLPTCGSTNDEARLRWDDPSVAAVGTDAQTAGRGRRGRAWFSPAGCGLYLTWIVRGALPPSEAPVLPLLAGLVTARLCERHGVRASLRWPNDVMHEGRKLAGVLCESRVVGDRLTALVGIGFNLRPPDGGYPAEVPATALGTARPAREVARELLGDLQAALSALPPGAPFSGVVPEWLARGPAVGTPLRTSDHIGTFAGLAPDGALLLDTGAATVRIESGEVSMVEPAT